MISYSNYLEHVYIGETPFDGVPVLVRGTERNEID